MKQIDIDQKAIKVETKPQSFMNDFFDRKKGQVSIYCKYILLKDPAGNITAALHVDKDTNNLIGICCTADKIESEVPLCFGISNALIKDK